MSEINEKEFAERIGVTRTVLAKLRGSVLSENTDFVKKGREVLLTESGAERAVELLAGSEQKEASEVLSDPERAVVRLWVYKVPLNPRVLMASAVDPADWKKNGAGKLLLVRVHSNANFIPKMALKARASERSNVYELVGRSPRWKGKY